MKEKQGIHWRISAVGICVALLVMMPPLELRAADVDGDGLDDAWETANGYSVLLKTHVVHVADLLVPHPVRPTAYNLLDKCNQLK